MLIEKHANATNQSEVAVTMNKDSYLFKLNENGDLVADVDADEHCQKLLAIPEAYRPYGALAQAQHEAQQAAAEAEAIAEQAKVAAAEAKEKAEAAKKAQDDAKANEKAAIKKAADEEQRKVERLAAIEEARQADEEAKRKARELVDANKTDENEPTDTTVTVPWIGNTEYTAENNRFEITPDQSTAVDANGNAYEQGVAVTVEYISVPHTSSENLTLEELALTVPVTE